MKSNSDVRPKVFQELGNGSTLYNFNIVESEKTQEDGTIQKTYDFDSVLFHGRPNYDSVVKAVIRDRRDETQEFALINKYNAYKLGISTDASYLSEYESYLEELAQIKSMVQSDIDAYNVK